MTKNFVKRDFVIKDLVISVGGGAGAGTWLPGPDGETPPSPISPIASILVNVTILELVRGSVIDAMRNKNFNSIGRAFLDGDPDGNPALRTAIREIGSAVVASAAYAAMSGGGGGAVGLVDPDKTFEGIPTPLTPVVHTGLGLHRVTELPRLKKQLAEVVAYVDKAIAAQTPHGADVGVVREQLEGALKTLGH